MINLTHAPASGQDLLFDVSPQALIDDLDLVVDDDDFWAGQPPARHGLQPITPALVARQVRRHHPEKDERLVRIATCVLFHHLSRGTRPYREAAWSKLRELFS